MWGRNIKTMNNKLEEEGGGKSRDRERQANASVQA